MNTPEKIYRYENEQEYQVLKALAQPVPKSCDLSAIIGQMFVLMRRAQGIGLAAPQVGISQRFFIIEIEKNRPLVFINPEIISTGADLNIHEEGCLSLPKLYAKVQRPASVRIQARDASYRLFTLEAEDILATCIQHELDHLNGVLFIDRLNAAAREQALRRYKKIVAKEQKKAGR